MQEDCKFDNILVFQVRPYFKKLRAGEVAQQYSAFPVMCRVLGVIPSTEKSLWNLYAEFELNNKKRRTALELLCMPQFPCKVIKSSNSRAFSMGFMKNI